LAGARLGLLRAAYALVTLASAAGFARSALLFPFYLSGGVSLAEARARFEPIRREATGRIGVSGSLWVLAEDYERMFVWGSAAFIDHSAESAGATLVLQQNYTGWAAPPEIANHRLVYSSFTTEAPALFGLRLANAMPGYAFAVYAPLN
jgi:hypothetical protein